MNASSQPANSRGGGPVIPHSSVVPPEIAVPALPDDDRVWVPQAPDVWFRPLMFNTVTGQWCNLLKVTAAGIVSRHRHPGAVFGYVLKGRWHYYEHDWVAEAGHFVYEPPGEIHTLAVPEDCQEMITFFNITGAMAYVDENGVQTGYEDTFTKIDMCREHYTKVGLGADFVDQFIR
ncbi:MULTISPECIES: 2,4'-dihydroxyacetophenone dioxygenase family protein [unclassified Streptomyces]|uniref:2,4'-dihydroxyacetophenone dioxygenase family protein n=1 Tax=unclassified Streptomyces TaxID=2593676 RepID=UPI002877D7B4|nr:2,4'-dihydroxyacetophenone dioxygenase family protein [Streptomyces sp. BB1-1-1]WND39704.1 2,4'-dihydroxyacetophenone dioxygenase family protein [Streptomyces sp. BB1-1-1]